MSEKPKEKKQNYFINKKLATSKIAIILDVFFLSLIVYFIQESIDSSDILNDYQYILANKAINNFNKYYLALLIGVFAFFFYRLIEKISLSKSKAKKSIKSSNNFANKHFWKILYLFESVTFIIIANFLFFKMAECVKYPEGAGEYFCDYRHFGLQHSANSIFLYISMLICSVFFVKQLSLTYLCKVIIIPICYFIFLIFAYAFDCFGECDRMYYNVTIYLLTIASASYLFTSKFNLSGSFPKILMSVICIFIFFALIKVNSFVANNFAYGNNFFKFNSTLHEKTTNQLPNTNTFLSILFSSFILTFSLKILADLFEKNIGLFYLICFFCFYFLFYLNY
jgi:hypothetical protein